MASYTLTSGGRSMHIEDGSEPIFVIRAKDNFALDALTALEDFYGGGDLSHVMELFQGWQQRNPEKCKEPD